MGFRCDICCDPTARLRVSARVFSGTASWCYRQVEYEEIGEGEFLPHYFMRSTYKSYTCYRIGLGARTLCLNYQEDQWIPGEFQLQGGVDYKPCDSLESEGGAIRVEIINNVGTCPPSGGTSTSGCDPAEDAGTIYSEEDSPPGAGTLLGIALSDLEDSEPLTESEGTWFNTAVSFDPDAPNPGPSFSAAGGEIDVGETGASILVTEFKIDNDGRIPLRLQFDLVTYRLEDDEELDRTSQDYGLPGLGSTGWMNLTPTPPDDEDSVYSVVENVKMFVDI